MTGVFGPEALQAVLSSNEDILGNAVLARGEPSYETVAGYLPDVTGYTFLGVPECRRKIAVESDGTLGYLNDDYGRPRIAEPIFCPADYVPVLPNACAKRGILGGYLPAIDYGFFDPDTGKGYEEMAFCAPPGGLEEPGTCHVALKIKGQWQFFLVAPPDDRAVDAGLVPPEKIDRIRPALGNPVGRSFFRALLCVQREWESTFAGGMQMRLPERRVEDACRAGLARARITYHGWRPEYGVGTYGQTYHDGFPPTTLFMVQACIDWGLADLARKTLDYYLTEFLRDDGSFDYYGPAVSEYGMLLDVAVRFARCMGGRHWLQERLHPLCRVAELLLRLREAALTRDDEGSPHRGLLYGSPEADTREQVNYYYSGSAWAWRGMAEFGRLLAEHGAGPARASDGSVGGDRCVGEPGEASDANNPIAQFGQRLRDVAAGLRENILRSAEAAVLPGEPAFLPPYPGITEPFPSMTCDTLASYTNYRYWPEMLSAGLLPDHLARAILDYRRARGGECFGTTRFAGQMDDWPLAHHAWGLLADDRVEEYLLTFYGHLAHHQMRGTFNSYEQVHVKGDGGREYAADYCVPVQLTVPLMTRWMLAWEERDEERLWLCKATPRRCLSPGSGISVRNAPTRWGAVSFTALAERDEVTVTLDLPQRGPAEVFVRLRIPGGNLPRRIGVEGTGAGEWDGRREAVVLRSAHGHVEVRVEW